MVVAVGLTLVEPVADVDVKVPGAMAILVAPTTIQLKVLLLPEVMLVGSAVKEAIVGAEIVAGGGVVEPQLVSPTTTSRIRITKISELRLCRDEWRPQFQGDRLLLARVLVLLFMPHV